MKSKSFTIFAALIILHCKSIHGGTFSHDMLRKYGINSHIMQTPQYFASPQKKTENIKSKQKNRKKPENTK